MRQEQCVEARKDIPPGLSRVKKLISDSLMHDWVLRVEHGVGNGKAGNSWQQWGDTEFAIKNASPVMESITACHYRHPDHSIRLYAEKMRPQTRLIYWIYRSNGPAGIEMQPVQAPENIVFGNIGRRLSDLYDGVRVARQKVWQTVAIAGMLLASLLMFEEMLA